MWNEAWRNARSSGRLVLLAAALLALPAAGWAQDEAEEAGPSPSPYFYVLKAKVEATKVDAYTQAVAKVVSAHQQHENGNSWAAFTPLTGGPESAFYFFLPMETMGAIDGWTPNRAVVAAVHGEEAADEVFRTLGETSKSRSMILAYMPAVSNLRPDWRPRLPAFIYHLHAKVDPAKIGDYVATVQKMAAAHQEHEKGLSWLGYSTIVGGEAGEFDFFIGMAKLGDMDGWSMGPEILVAKYGEEGAAAIRQAFPGMSTARDQILALSPSLSNLPPMPGGEGE